MVVAVSWDPAVAEPEPSSAAPGSEPFVAEAEVLGRTLPPTVRSALLRMVDSPPREGAILVRGVPVGELPPTPASPTEPTTKDHVSELVLTAVARTLGEPVGYRPEHGGDLVQNLVPTVAGADRQVSTSSRVDLAFHTETAFHPHAPRFLVLLCLRGHPDARTTLCSVHDLIDALDGDTLSVLRQARFVCGVDESFLDGARAALASTERRSGPGSVSEASTGPLGPRGPFPVIGGTADRPTLWYDADLMRGTDPAAQAALDRLDRAVAEHHCSVVLEAGDCLVVDNTAAVHGRSSYQARFDGTDRWLQRAFVVTDLDQSAADRDGRIIQTLFA